MMELVEYKTTYNGLLSLLYVVTYSLRKFQRYSGESCAICRRLEAAVSEAEEIVLQNEIIPYEMYKKAFVSLFEAVQQISEYAAENKTVEGVGDVNSCLNLIMESCGVCTKTPESSREMWFGMEKVVDSILKPLRRI